MLRTGDLAGLEAGGADVHLLALAIHHAVDALDVGAERTVGHAVGVADGATSNGVLTADFANFGHIQTLLGWSGTIRLNKQIGTIAQRRGHACNLHEEIYLRACSGHARSSRRSQRLLTHRFRLRNLLYTVWLRRALVGQMVRGRTGGGSVGMMKKLWRARKIPRPRGS